MVYYVFCLIACHIWAAGGGCCDLAFPADVSRAADHLLYEILDALVRHGTIASVLREEGAR